MKLRRLPPSASPLSCGDLWAGAVGLLRARQALERLRAELAGTLGVDHVFLVSSGRAGLTLILRALRRLSRRRRVIVPAYTCFSVPAAVIKAGLEVVPCDIDLKTLDFDYGQLEALVRKTDPLCVVPVHLFGCPADVRRVQAVCRPRGIFVVEDAAHAFGVSGPAGALGTTGDVGFFSFGRGKQVTSIHGGAVVTDAPDIAEELLHEYDTWQRPGLVRGLATLTAAVAVAGLLRPTLYWIPASLPFLELGKTEYSTRFVLRHLSGTEAGLLRHWQGRLARTQAARAELLSAFEPWIPKIPGLTSSACLRIPVACATQAERARLMAGSEREGLGLSAMYPTAITAIPELKEMCAGHHVPSAEWLADRLLTVPVHALVTPADQRAIEALLAGAHFASEEKQDGTGLLGVHSFRDLRLRGVPARVKRAGVLAESTRPPGRSHPPVVPHHHRAQRGAADRKQD